MPTYIFKDNDTGEVFERWMKIAEREEFLKDNPNLEPVLSAPQIISGTTNSMKVSDGFKETMSKIGDKFPGSNLDNRYNKKSVKQAKTDAVIEKHRKKQGK
jgi:hypothetical protein